MGKTKPAKKTPKVVTPTAAEMDAATQEAKADMRKPTIIDAYHTSLTGWVKGEALGERSGRYLSMPDKDRFLKALMSLEGKATKRRTRGLHMCQCCCKKNRVGMGLYYQFEGVQWGEYLRHYVEEHNIKLDDQFVAFVMKHAPVQKPAANPNVATGVYILEGTYQIDNTSGKKNQYTDLVLLPDAPWFAIYPTKTAAEVARAELQEDDDDEGMGVSYFSLKRGNDHCVNVKVKAFKFPDALA